jgi:hypothetical protein
MKTIATLAILLILFVGFAGAVTIPVPTYNYGPQSGFKNPGTIEGSDILVDDDFQVGDDAAILGDLAVTGTLTGTASRIAVGSFIDTGYGLKNSTANKAWINITADKGLEFGTGTALGSLQAEAGNGIKLSSAGIAVEPTDIIATSYGLMDSSDDIRVNLTTDDGLEFGAGAALGSLGVKAGDGIDTGSTGVLVDATDIINTANGLYESSENNIAVNLTDNDGLGFGTGAELGALILVPSSGIKNTANGVEVNYTSSKGLAIGTGTEEGALLVNLTTNRGLEFGSGALLGSLGIKLDGYSLVVGASGLKLNGSNAITTTATVQGEQITSTDDARIAGTTTTDILHVNTTSTYAGKASFDTAISIDPYEPTNDGVGMSDANIRTPVFVGNASNNQTLTLPTAAAADGCSLKFIVKTDPGTYNFVLEGNGVETINGAQNKSSTTQYDSLEVTSNGVAWYITSSVGTWT